jgi:hypothetical protein
MMPPHGLFLSFMRSGMLDLVLQSREIHLLAGGMDWPALRGHPATPDSPLAGT